MRRTWAEEETAPRNRPSAHASSSNGLLHLQSAYGNRAVSGLVATVQRQAHPRASGPMSRARFIELMRTRYGIFQARAGTFADQQEVNSRRGVSAAGRLVEAAWVPWDPGQTSDIYESVLRAFEDFESSLGGIPPVNEVLFFATAYEVDHATHQVVATNRIGADFGLGHLRIYRAGVDSGAGGRKGIPIGRSTTAGRYPPVFATLSGRGTDPGAPIPLPTAGENTVRVITHELGHGLAEQAMAADPGMFDQYRLAVGWVGDALFDVGIPEVRRALNVGVVPPPTIRVRRGGQVVSQPTEITLDSWNHPRWIEQPISAYTVTGGAGEDFAEAVMAYVNARAVLQARSPARFQFLDSRRASWLPFLVTRPPVGDFPAISGSKRVT